MPISVFLIRHPNRPVLFDTGESPHWNDPGYVSSVSPVKFVTQVSIKPEDGIVTQLQNCGVQPRNLQAIVISQLHADYAGGLQELSKMAPNVPVYVSEAHWEVAGKSPLIASLMGYTPQHYPEGFTPRLFRFEKDAVGPWKESCKITSDGNIVVVQTPGHVPGHVSLIIYGHGGDGETPTTYLLPGDATYRIKLLDREEPDGMNGDPVAAQKSLQLIKEFARQSDVVVLPSHDPDTPRLLRDRIVYKPQP